MNPSFDFVFGKPANDDAGRWVEGSVVDEGPGYTFVPDLLVRHAPTTWQCHRVRLQCGRPFRPGDFAAYLRLVSTGKFQTLSRVLGLYETRELDPAGASAIFAETAVWLDPWDHECLYLLQDLTSLGDQLEQVHKREQLSQALARFSQHGRPPDGDDK